MKTQNQRLLKHFGQGKTITVLTAITELGILNPKARISELRHPKAGDIGWDIRDRWITVYPACGGTCKIKEYWLNMVDA